MVTAAIPAALPIATAGLNDATLVIILLAIWLLSSGGLSGYGGCGCGCNTCGGGRSGCGDCGCGCN